MQYFCKQSPFKALLGLEKSFIILYTRTFFQDLILSKLTESQRTQGSFFGKDRLGWDLATKGRLLVWKSSQIIHDDTVYAYSFTRYLF